MSKADEMRFRGGNGCLLALVGVGFVLVVLGMGIEALPEREASHSSEPGSSVVLATTPEPPEDPYEAPMVPEPLIDPLGVAPRVDTTPGTPIFWHAEWPGDPTTPCVLAMETTSDHRMNRLTLACADGRLLEGSIPPTSPEGLATSSAAVYRAVFRGQASDSDGVSFTIAVDTHAHRLDVTQTDVGLHSELYIEDWSVPVPGQGSAFAQSQVTESAVRLAVPTLVTGRVPRSIALTRGTGRSPRANDPVCELSASPAMGRLNCRVTVRCNGEVIYGAGTSGYNGCVVRGGTIVSARDEGTSAENGDPRLELDLDSGRLTVSDVVAGSEWSATFDLHTDPRCEVASFEGRVTTGDSGVRWQRWQLESGTPPGMTWTGGEVSPLDIRVFCAEGYALGRRPDGTADLTFGTGFRSLAGYASPDGAPLRGIYAFRR